VGRMQRVFQILREEAENASELTSGADDPLGVQRLRGLGPDALSVQGNQIGRGIRNFDDARRSDLLNERLPEVDPNASQSGFPLVPTPSMRRGSADQNMDMEVLIRRTLEEEGGDSGLVEVLAERIARGRRVTGRPRALKRFETA